MWFTLSLQYTKTCNRIGVGGGVRTLAYVKTINILWRNKTFENKLLLCVNNSYTCMSKDLGTCLYGDGFVRIFKNGVRENVLPSCSFVFHMLNRFITNMLSCASFYETRKSRF